MERQIAIEALDHGYIVHVNVEAPPGKQQPSDENEHPLVQMGFMPRQRKSVTKRYAAYTLDEAQNIAEYFLRADFNSDMSVKHI